MIHTLTLNPALDISGVVESLVPDEKSYVFDERHTPGGNGINAAIMAHRLKARIIASGLIGGPNGEEIKSLLDKGKVKHAFISIAGHTRMNLTVSNRKTHRQTRLSFSGPKIKAAELKSIQNYFEAISSKDMVVIGGSLPPGIKPTFVKSLVKKLKLRGITTFVDMPGNLMGEVLKAGPYFIKPNLTEFQDLVGKKVESISSVLPLIRKLNERVPLICVSSVEGGALLVSKDEAWFGKIPKVKIFSSVGAGDSMVGAIASKLHQNPKTSVEELLRWGLASACATLTEKGMTLGTRAQVIKYYPQIKLREIQ